MSGRLGQKHSENGVGSGTVFDHFAELEETCLLIDNLPRISRDFIALEASQERFTRKEALPNCAISFLLFSSDLYIIIYYGLKGIVDKYQEQPHLLDPHLGEHTSLFFFLPNTYCNKITFFSSLST